MPVSGAMNACVRLVLYNTHTHSRCLVKHDTTCSYVVITLLRQFLVVLAAVDSEWCCCFADQQVWGDAIGQSQGEYGR